MMKMMLKRLIPLFVIALTFVGFSHGDTLFFDDFNDGYAGWSSSGNVASDDSPSLTPNSVRMKQTGAIWRTISTVGSTNISITWNMAAQSLEDSDFCYFEVNTGSGWTVKATLANGDDDLVFRNGTVYLGTEADNNPNLQVRFRVAGNALGDYCYAEDITVSDGASGGGGGPGGGGERTLLTADYLLNGTAPTAPVDDAALGMPASAGAPLHVFEGRLELLGEDSNGDFSVLRDDYNYDADPERKFLPEFDFEFVQDGSDLIPVIRGDVNTAHPFWTYIIGPGKVWSETTDQGYSRASFPFAIVQRNSNCTQNGTMTFLFNNAGVSKVYYQITQETCLYFKADFFGLLSANYHAGSVATAAVVKTDFAAELANKFPTKPFSDLAVDYPGVDLSQFGFGISHMTKYGVVANGVNYVSDCVTRYGSYPYCEWMRLPSYSTAKSLTGVTMMAAQQKYDSSLPNLLIKDYVTEVNSSIGDWSSVSFDHTADMATGNYKSAIYMADEGSALMNNFFLDETYTAKMDRALGFRNKVSPGTKWVYHTSDYFILMRGLTLFLETHEGVGADAFDFLVDEVFKPIQIGPGSYQARRTSDNNWQGDAFGGYGMWWLSDDIAKLSNFLNVDGGAVGATQILHPGSLAASMQADASDRGLDTGTANYKYNNGFWAKQFTTSDGVSCDAWVPFFSGYGGISVAMLPNGVTYYYFSDGDDFSWSEAVIEIDANIKPLCQ